MQSSEDEGPKLVNPRIHELEKKAKPVLSHDIGAGSPCTKCECEGLDLHFWRKRCKNCSCRLEDHDVVMEKDHGQILIGRLFGAHLIFEGNLISMTPSSHDSSSTLHEPSYAVPDKTSSRSPIPSHIQTKRFAPSAQYNVRIEGGPLENCRNITEYSWAPMKDARMVEKYMESLPQDERPVRGSEGEMKRKRRLAYQLPLFDFSQDNERVNGEEKESRDKFISYVRHKVAGVGEIVEMDTDSQLNHIAKRMNMEEYEGSEMERRNISATDCRECSKRLQEGNTVVQTEHGTHQDVWHPSCFRCCVCNELLADLIYFYHKGNYYCGRHFAEKQYPRCAGCEELIFAKEYTLAEGKSWHLNHFACDKCDLRLGGHKYITKDEQPHCLQCYLKYYAKKCEGCGRKICADEKRLNHGEMHWHATAECFKCHQCSINLIGHKFLLKDSTLFCSAECKVEYTRK